jgi:mono/diheme cytochrome c family protein
MKLHLLFLAILALPARAGAAEEKLFEERISPIFTKHCIGCHGLDDEKAKLNLTSFADVIKGGKSGAVVVPGKSAESILFERITSKGERVMPPKKAKDPLSEEEIAAIKAWIDGGALWKGGAPRPAALEAGAGPGKGATDELVNQAVPAPIASVSFAPSGKLFALGGDRTVTVLEAQGGRQAARLQGHAESVRALTWSPDGALLAAAGGLPARGGEVILWDASSWKQAGALEGHRDCIYAVAFSPDGSKIATASYDRLIKLWDSKTLVELLTLKDHIDAVYSLAFSLDGASLFSAAADRTVKVWETSSGKRLFTLSDATLGLSTVALSPTGKEVAAAGQDRMIRIWRVENGSGTLLRSSFAHEGAILKIAYSADGKSLFSTAEDKLIKSWDARALTEKLVFEKQPDWVLDLSVRNDGKAILGGRYDGSWALYDAETGKRLLSSEDKPEAQVAAEGRGQPKQKTAAADEKTAAGEGESKTVKRKKRELLVDVVDAGSVTVPPSLGGVWPRAVSRGGKAVLAIDGKNLAAAELAFFEPGFTARIKKNDALPRPEFRRVPGNTGAEIVDLSIPHKLEVELEIAPEARAGMHRFLALTPAGATNSLSLFVERWPEAPEKEPNDSTADATEMSSEALEGKQVILGSMQKRGDADYFRFVAKAGQELVFHILSESIGSSLNGLLTLLAPDGSELRSSGQSEFGNRSEGRVAYHFEKEGAYYLRISDKSFGEGGFYRLYSGALPFVTSFFPPGLQKGTSREISVKGFNLGGGMRVKVDAPAEAGWGAKVPLPIPGALQGGSVAVGDAAEVIEAEPDDEPAKAQRVEAPSTINGVIGNGVGGSGTDADYYVFQAKAGQSLIVDVMARRLGSRLDSVIEVLDSKGKSLERATLRCVAQTFVTLSDRDARSTGLRLDSWADLRVNDFVMVGSEVLKVRLLPDYPDEDVLFFGHGFSGGGSQRSGYLDTTPEFHAVNEPVYKVEIHPAGREFPPNGMPVFHLPYRNDDGGAPIHGEDSLLHFTAPADGDYMVWISDAQGRGGQDLYYRLQLRQPRPDFEFFVNAENLNIPRGSRVPFSVSVNRLDDFNGTINVELADPLPPGFSLEAAAILPDQDEATLTVRAEPETKSTPLERTFRLRARATIGGKEVAREGAFRMLRVTGNPDLVLTQEPREIHIKPGGTAAVTVHATRQNGFAGRIPLDVTNLPHGVVVMDTGLNGILIPEGEETRVYKIYAEPWATPLKRSISTVGRTETSSPLPTQFAAEPATLVIEAEGVVKF